MRARCCFSGAERGQWLQSWAAREGGRHVRLTTADRHGRGSYGAGQGTGCEAGRRTWQKPEQMKDICLVLAAVVLASVQALRNINKAWTPLFPRAVTAVVGVWLTASPANAVVLSGRVSLGEGVAGPTSSERALYLTVRQDGGIWQDRVRNFKPPPVLSKRIPASELGSEFPCKVMLDSKTDATPEGLQLESDWTSGRTPLLVTARLDMDGVAATRSPEDVVGQTTISLDGQGSWPDFQLELAGRGLTGKFITQQRK